jgi:hypothetical protein
MSNYYEGKSGVNVRRLVRNIADQYPFKPQIAVIVELIANCLDAKASKIEINFNKLDGILEVTDNGSGMDRGQLIEYHDFAATTKERGKGIGFAGQGAKLALNFCSKVVTETWSASYKGYSEWQLKGNEAPYRIYDNRTLDLDHTGTRVTLFLDDKSKNFYTEDLIIQVLKEHYYPLLDSRLLRVYTGEVPILTDGRTRLKIYKPIYGKGLKFIVNGKEVAKQSIQDMLENQKEVSVTVYRSPRAKGFFGLAKDELPEILQGIAICTYGKVIERTWFKKEPSEKRRITGWIEASYLIKAVTTDKCRFQKGNKAWEGFFRKARKEFSEWLEETGLLEKPVRRPLDYIKLEREINSILKNLPELSFFGSSIQRDVAIPDVGGIRRKMGEGTQKVRGTIGGETTGGGVSVHPGEEPGKAPTLEPGVGIAATPKRRIVRGGIQITEVERPDLDKEAWFDGEVVAVNKSYPAYKKAKTSGLLNYHLLKAIVLSLIEFSLGRDPEASYQKVFELQQKFFKLWGER